MTSLSRKRKLIWLVLIGLAPLPLLHAVHQFDVPNAALEPYRAKTMRFVESAELTPPLDAEWQSITADSWIVAPIHRDRFNSSWLAVDPPYGGGARELGLYLPYPDASVDVFVGQLLVGSNGTMQRPLHYQSRSTYFRLPDSTSLSPEEPVYIHLARERGYLNANGVVLGPADVLEKQYRADRLANFWLPGIVATLMLGLALSMFVLYLTSTRRFAYFGLYALIVVLWALHTIHSLIADVPIYHWLWIALIYLLLWWAILTPAFANRFFSLGQRKLEVTTIAGGLLLTVPILVLLALFEIDLMYRYIQMIWVPYVLLCSSIAVGLYVVASWDRWSFESLGLYFVGAIALTFGVRDHLFDFYLWVPGTTYYTKFVAMGQIAFINLLIARRYSKSEDDLMNLNRDLEQRIETKARELEAGYQERRQLERDRTLAEERERLMRDMHDGLGGQLIQALAVSEREDSPDELRESLQHALTDLRLIVDSVAPEHGDLVSLLASWRHRSQRVWNRSGVEIRWSMADLPPIDLGPERSLDVLRIVQEASTNALRHSGAQTISISGYVDGSVAVVEVHDDGEGFDSGVERVGRGLDSMRRRASEAQVELIIDSGNKGTQVFIRIPYSADGTKSGRTTD